MASAPSFLRQAINILKAFLFSPLWSLSKQVIAAWLNPRRPPNCSHWSPSSRDRCSNSPSDGTPALNEAEDNNGRRRKKLEKGCFKYLANGEQWWRKVISLFFFYYSISNRWAWGLSGFSKKSFLVGEKRNFLKANCLGFVWGRKKNCSWQNYELYTYSVERSCLNCKTSWTLYSAAI